MKLYVGIDVSSQKLDVCFLDSEDNILKECSLINDFESLIFLKLLFLDQHQQSLLNEYSFCCSRSFLRQTSK